jgi:serine/threonine-protein kinase
LTGRPPFQGRSYVELLHKHRYGQFDNPQKIVPEIPHEIDEMVCQLLEKEPDKRPRDAHVFTRQLEGIRKKLERKGSQTQVDNRGGATQAENRVDKLSMEALPGPATLMSRLVRAGLDEQNQGGPLSRLFNRPWVLVLLLLCCIGILSWGLWPLSEEELFRRGAKLMESESLYDMQQAWTEYLGPLKTRFPNNPYEKELEVFHRKYETAKAPHPSEAQRFFQQGEILKQQGNLASAQKKWRALIVLFEDVEAEREWVYRAKRALNELEKAAANNDRWKNVRAKLAQANELSQQGKVREAEQLLKSIEELYGDDPAAADLMAEVRKARQKEK